MDIAFLDNYKNVNASVINPVFLVVSTCDVDGICWFTHGRRNPDSNVGVDDSKHSAVSYSGAKAIDMQIWDGAKVNKQGMERLEDMLNSRLPSPYDVVMEEPGEYQNDHLLLHVEYDPKDVGHVRYAG